MSNIPKNINRKKVGVMGMLLENTQDLGKSEASEIQNSVMSNIDAGEFNRIEDKHVVDVKHLSTVLDVLNKQMIPSYLDNGTEFTLIESLYFDSAKFDFFKHHFSGMESRHKLRSRRYAPNGVWTNAPALLELKTKRHGCCNKTRFKVPAEDFAKLVKGEEIPLTQDLIKLNSSIDKAVLMRRVEQINELVTQFHLHPTVSVVYHRYAFEAENFRVTVDTNIQVKILAPLAKVEAEEIKKSEVWERANKIINKYDAQNNFVLETKHQGIIPDWMVQLMSDVGIKKTSFSKYCWGIAKEVESQSTILQ